MLVISFMHYIDGFIMVLNYRQQAFICYIIENIYDSIFQRNKSVNLLDFRARSYGYFSGGWTGCW